MRKINQLKMIFDSRSVNESFSDKLKVRSKVGVGTTVTIEKKIMGKVK